MKLPSMLFVGALFASPALGQETIFRTIATADASNFGSAAACAGDVNNDGTNDLIVGSTLDIFGGIKGRALVYSGTNGALLHTFVGSGPTGRFGAAVACAGDVNNDGHDDVIVGHPDSGTAFLIEGGRAWVYSGLDGSLIHVVLGAGPFDHAGTSVAGVGDLDGDDHDDFIVGHPGFPNGAEQGRAIVYSGADASALYIVTGSAAGDNCGHEVAGLGDFNGDTIPEFAVGSPRNDANGNNTGRVRVYSGIDGTRLYTKRGDEKGDQFGRGIAAVTDLNNDLVDDFLVSTPFTDVDGQGNSFGSAYGYSGADGTRLFHVQGDSPTSNFGSSISGAGDVNGDGVGDFIVGAAKADVPELEAGQAHLYSGANLRRLYTFFGEVEDANSGASVGTLGDVDGDGLSDVFVGAPGAPTGFGGGGGATGTVTVSAGNETYLMTNDTTPADGTLLELTSTSGKPGNLTLLFVNRINNIPCICRVGGIGTFDGNGERPLTTAVPPGLTGLRVVLQSFGVDDGGDFTESAELLLAFD